MPDTRHPRLVTNLKHYAALPRETGRSAEAAEMERRAAAIRAERAQNRRATGQ